MADSAMEVGKKLLAYIEKGEHLKAIDELYADDATQREAADGGDEWPREQNGKAEIKAKTQEWFDLFDVHDSSLEGPFPHDDSFIIISRVEATGLQGPVRGQRIHVTEACHYTVKDGKITRGVFYYETPDGC